MAERSAAAGTQRVALLARAGKAADNLADALRQAGADLVLVADPNTLDESVLLAARPQAVLVALEPGIEQAIDRLDAVLSSPALTVIFDEADLAAHRAGWDSARWVRHLSAKLHHHQQVLPPGGEAETEEWYPSPGQLPKPTSAFSDLDLGAFAEEAAVRAGSVPIDGMNSEGIDFDAFVQAPALTPAVVEPASSVAVTESFEIDDLTLAPMDASFDAPTTESPAVESLAVEPPAIHSPAIEPPGPLEVAPMRTDFDELSMTEISLDDFVSDATPMQDLRFDAEPETAADIEMLQIDERVVFEAVPQSVQPMQFDDDAFFLEELSASGSKAESFEAMPTFDFDLIPETDTAPPATSSAAARRDDFDLEFTELSFEADNDGPSAPIAALAAAPPVEQNPPSFAQNSFGELSLATDDAPIQRPATQRTSGSVHDLTALEARISGLSLVDIEGSETASSGAPGVVEDALPPPFESQPPPIPQQIAPPSLPPSPPQIPAVAETSRVAELPPAAVPNIDARGIVLIEAGLGGPDPVRQVLAGLPPTFPMPVLVRLHLQGGRYDRLVTQMERAASLPVMLAEVGDLVRAGCIYFLPEGVGLHALSYGLEFIAHPSPARTIFAALPAEESAVVFLSGSDTALIEDVMQAAEAGALVAAQSPGDCYDGAACADLSSRGAASGLPPELARRLVSRWAS